MDTNTELHIKVSADENEYIHALTISKQEIIQYCIKPYKYLRFLGAIIFGRRQSSGSLSDSIGGDPFDEDMYACDKLQHDKVYFTSEVDAHFLIDVDGAKTTRSFPGSSSTFTRNVENEHTVRVRDGDGCIMSGFAYKVCHLIAHSKGNDYIENVTKNTSTPIEEIDDARNMLCLEYSAHAMLGLSILAFLQTPNIGITREDIPLSEQPSRRPPSERDSTQLTIHYFPKDEADGFSIATHCKHNANVWQPLDKDNWPPIEVFNFVYALAAVKYWGVDPFMLFARTTTRGLYGEEPEERRRKRQQEKEAKFEKKKQKKLARLLARELKRVVKDGESIDDTGDYSEDDNEYDAADTLFGFQELNRRLARNSVDTSTHQDESAESCPVNTYKDEFTEKWVQSVQQVLG